MAAPQQADVETPRATLKPDPQVIAFAISVVRSKPPELSVREYIHLLRQHVTRGKRADAVSSKHQHLDRSSFWRSECERSQEALKLAEDRTVDLRREIDSLKNKIDTARPSSPNKKRKKPDGDTIPVPRSPKKARRDVSPGRNAPFALDMSGDLEFEQAGDIGVSLLRSVYNVQATMRAFGKTDSTKLAYHIVKAAPIVPKIVQQDFERHFAESSPNLDQMNTVLTVTGRAVASIFAGVNRLSSVADSSEVHGNVVHAVVKMFKDLLAILEQLSSGEVKKATAEADTSKGKKATNSKPKAKTKSARTTNIKDSPVLNLYTSFLASLIDMLDQKAETSKALFEGFAYCILDGLGERLYLTAFGHARAPTLEAEILQSREIDEIEDDDSTPLPSQETTQQKQLKIEAPYLAHLLNRIMAAAPSYLGSIINSTTGKPKQVGKKGSAKGVLAITAKECLQSTLVNAIFGTEGTDEDDPFMDCLKMPSAGNAVMPFPKVKETEVGDWFKGQVWNVLGWEILSREGGR